ncbi:sigma-70 family RNA polymerase sigma factor [Cupriavidus basilensis]|uniref:Sigma-70 family RNA polymerase sigma factor n=1 Tax=Cupriavidus basilensis TaxID=68895 RepID=A0ABT6AZ37_9BURK|nr:sigma-70 family RNA polymerase sigma factor [Cupriavidus basilensis]MDF3837880.1 sigma-70 family RNA polymerase sigma factor [Cupriavidus basilensis]
MSAHLYLEVADAVDALSDDRYHTARLRECLVANYERLHRRLQRHLGCPDQASDTLHDAWLRLGDATLSTAVQNSEAYVYRVACNLATDQLRHFRPWQYTNDADTELENLADDSPSPDRIAEVRSDLAAVDRALDGLPRRHQDVLMNLRLEEMTRQEVANRLGVSLRHVDTLLRQALDHCAEQTGQPVIGGVSTPRRRLHKHWRAKVTDVLAARHAA